MKAVVVTPSICDFYFTPGRAAGLGAISVKNQLEKSGVECNIYNLPLMSPRGKKVIISDTFDYLKPYLIPRERGPISFFNSYKRYGPNPVDSANIIFSSAPDIIFISLFAWAYAEDAISLAKEIKKQKDIIICIGGAGVSVLPEYFKKFELFDYIITGDAEDVIPLLINKLTMNNNDFIPIPHLYGVEGSHSDISKKNPEPVVSLKYDKKGNQWLSITLSRGCPLKCKFCSNFLTQGRVFRGTETNKLIEELKKLDISKDNPLHINLEDDNLLIRKSYFESTLYNIKELFPNATFSIDNGLDYTYMTPDYVDFLIDMGFNSFTLSLGTYNYNILEEEQRPGDFKVFEAIIYRINKRGIPVNTFLICGLPGDNKECILRSLLYIHKLPTNTGISLFYPVPGLPRFEDKQLFLNRSSHLCCGSSAYPWAGSLTTEEMVTAFRLARLSNMIKSDYKNEELINKIIEHKSLYTLEGKSKKIIQVPGMNDFLVKGFLSKIT